MIRFVILPLLIGCASGPVPEGLSWTVKNKETVTRTTFMHTMGGNPKASIGPIGTGATCLLAQESQGSSISKTISETYITSTVLGYTEVYHPLVPNDETYSATLASVIQQSTQGASSTETITTSYDPTGTFGLITNTVYTDTAIETEASFHGVSADEYLVQFPLGNIWKDPEEDLRISDVELLTRVDPEMGDIWASTNGNTIYIAQAKEPKGQGKAQKIYAYAADGVTPDTEGEDDGETATGANVIDECFNIGLAQFQTNDPASESVSLSQVLEDSGCSSVFEHVKVGTEWWFRNVKIDESSTSYDVEITDFGYEWYEMNETGDTCTRVTSRTLDNPAALLFVQYDLIETVLEAELDSWSE